MWPVVLGALRRYTPFITLPFAAVVGFIGYHIEGWVTEQYTQASAPIKQKRDERLLESLETNAATIRKHNPLEVNLSPSLSS